MTLQPKFPILRSKLFKQQSTHLSSIPSHYYSDIRNLRTSSSSTKISVKSYRSANNPLKNTHFSTSLFEQAHKINPAVQSYLPKSVQPISNEQKTRALLPHKQKSQRSLKSRKVFKSLSLNRGDSASRQQIVQNQVEKQRASKQAVCMSSLTFLIMNGCEYACQQQIKKGKINKTKAVISTEAPHKHLKSTSSKHCEPKCDNPYQLPSSRRAQPHREKARR